MAEITAEEEVLRSVREAFIFDWMEKNQVKALTVNFHGEGDDGSFDEYIEITCNSDNCFTIDYLTKSLADTKISFPMPDNGGNHSLHQLILDFSMAIEGEAFHQVDWVNNEGGQGKIEWILDGEGADGNHYKRGVCLTVEQRVIEYQTEHYSVFGLAEEPE